MHKNFANTRFLGKRVFFLPECHSTNDVLLEFVRKKQAREGDVVVTGYQTAGRGQRGNTWESEPGKNLLFSVLLQPKFLLAESVFLLNAITSVALAKTLSHYLGEHELRIKWPNDIYVNDRKISGILIQTQLEDKFLKLAVVGIGLNVNQTFFQNPKATSMMDIVGNQYDKQEILENLAANLEEEYFMIRSGSDEVFKEYEKLLYWKGKSHFFRIGNEVKEGVIDGINNFGQLKVNFKDEICNYNIKEIEFIR